MKDTSILYKMSYWLAWPFWPREMRDLIKKYKAEGTLNEDWFDAHCSGIALVFFLMLGMLILIVEKEDFLVPLALLIMMSLSFVHYLRDVFVYMISPYQLTSEKGVLEVGSIRFNCAPFVRQLGGVVYKISEEENRNVKIFSKIWKQEDYPPVKSKVSVYIEKHYNRGIVPDLEYMKRAYSLTTEIFNEQEFLGLSAGERHVG